MKTTSMRDFHVRLPGELHGWLREEARRLEQPATEVARFAIEVWLRNRRRAALNEAIRAWAGTGTDLAPELERSSIEHLSGDERAYRLAIDPQAACL